MILKYRDFIKEELFISSENTMVWKSNSNYTTYFSLNLGSSDNCLIIGSQPPSIDMLLEFISDIESSWDNMRSNTKFDVSFIKYKTKLIDGIWLLLYKHSTPFGSIDELEDKIDDISESTLDTIKSIIPCDIKMDEYYLKIKFDKPLLFNFEKN